MKVICIDINNGDTTLLHMTIGKTYNVLDTDNHGYLITSNNSRPQWYSKRRFIPLSDIREEILNKILEC